MPNAFLTGIRNLRSSFLSGAMLIASVYILATSKFQSSIELGVPATKLFELHGNMPLFITALTAYLIGSLYVTALEGVVDYIHRKRLSLETEDNGKGLTKFISEALAPLSPASGRRLKIEAARFFNEKSSLDLEVTDDRLNEFTRTVFADVLWMEGKLAGTKLREIYAEYRAEGEFRLSIGLLLPLAVYAFAISAGISGTWLAALLLLTVVIAVQTCNYGLYYFRRAHSFLAHHVSDGNLLTPSMETLKQTSAKDPSTRKSTAKVKMEDTMERELFQFEASDGSYLVGSWEVPDDTKSEFPLVILATGDGPNGSKGQTWQQFIPLFKKSGIGTFLFDFSGLGHSPGVYQDLTLSIGRRNFCDVMNYVSQHGAHNKSRIGVVGSSFGGNVALLEAANFPNIAAVGLKSASTFMPEGYERELGSEKMVEWAYSNFLDEVGHTYSIVEDALFHNTYEAARNIECPVRIVHGTADSSVPIRHARDLLRILKSGSMLEIEGADHWYAEGDEWQRMADDIVDFMAKTL